MTYDPMMDGHRCMHYRYRTAGEGDDVLIEKCARCGRVRYEADGVRPMAWFVDTSNPTGHRYVYADPHNNGPSQWKYPATEKAT